jgi:hypothetical protein
MQIWKNTNFSCPRKENDLIFVTGEKQKHLSNKIKRETCTKKGLLYI